MANPKTNLGAGASLAVKEPFPPGTPVKHGEYTQASRALALGSYFFSGLMAINASQILSSPLYLINKDWYNAWIAFTKQSFGLLTSTMTQCWAPTVVRVSGDKSVRGQLLKTVEGNLVCDFPERLVLIANHQIYTDWLYLWWIAYTNGMHGRLYIVLKESLKRIPVLGWGMQFSQFIFLKRNWEQDKPHMASHLQRLNKSTDPMWLMIFPEGTNLAPSTRQSSKKWAANNNMRDMKHQLLPRTTGLQFCLQQLRQTVDYVYDCTVAYEGVPHGEYAQDIFTIKASYLEGRPPKSVNMYWRRFKVSSIPIDNDKAFEIWLRARWTEKDALLEQYLQTGRFPADTGAGKTPGGKVRRGAGHIESEIKAGRWYEFMQVFAPAGLLALVLYAFYGALPKRFMKSIDKDSMQKKVEAIRKNLEIENAKKLLMKSVPSLFPDTRLPIGLIFDMLTQRGLPITTVLKALSDTTLMKSSIPRGITEKKLLTGPTQTSAQTTKSTSKPATGATISSTEITSAQRTPPGTKSRGQVNSKPATAQGSAESQKQVVAQKLAVAQKAAVSQKQSVAQRLAVAQNEAAAQKQVAAQKLATKQDSSPVQRPVATQRSSTAQKINTTQVKKPGTGQKPGVTPRSSVRQNATLKNNPATKEQSAVRQKVAANLKPAAAPKPGVKKRNMTKVPLSEKANPKAPNSGASTLKTPVKVVNKE